MANAPDIKDIEWLLAATTGQLIERLSMELAGGRLSPSPALVERLRREVTVSQASLVLQQIALRHRAARKFSRAKEMIFAPVLLEQSTSEWISAYKARCFPDGSVLDLCCGIGGDAVGMAASGVDVTVADRNPVATKIASYNTSVYGSGKNAAAMNIDAVNAPVESFSAWHIDPDRRPDSRRTTHVALHEPGLEALYSLLSRNPNAAIKLAPATELPEQWLGSCEREWIGELRECKQQLLRFGALARHLEHHTATIVDGHGEQVGSVSGQFEQPVEYTSTVSDYLYEPHAAVRAAGLTGALANQLGLKRIGLATCYMTGGCVPTDAAVAGFQVLESMPLDRKRVKQRIRDLGIGPLEVKTRGLKLDPAGERKRLSAGEGQNPGTVFLFSAGDRTLAVLARRVTKTSPKRSL